VTSSLAKALEEGVECINEEDLIAEEDEFCDFDD